MRFALSRVLIAGALALSGCALPDAAGDCPPMPVLEYALEHTRVTLQPNIDSEGLPRLHRSASCLPPENTVTWLGHASFIVRLSGKVLLLDPLLVKQLYGDLPSGQRRVPFPAFLDHLDRLDAILISHGHSDHVNGRTLRSLNTRFPDTPVLVPSALMPLMADLGVSAVVPVEQYAPFELDGLRLTAVPVRHETKPLGLDLRREKMPSGWVIEAGSRQVYFAGDTAYGDHGRETRERLGASSIALVPIGNYEPECVACGAHGSPEDAAHLVRDLGATVAIGHHWGTYTWGIEVPSEVRRRFLATARPGFRPLIVDLGEPIAIPN